MIKTPNRNPMTTKTNINNNCRMRLHFLRSIFLILFILFFCTAFIIIINISHYTSDQTVTTLHSLLYSKSNLPKSMTKLAHSINDVYSSASDVMLQYYIGSTFFLNGCVCLSVCLCINLPASRPYKTS